MAERVPFIDLGPWVEMVHGYSVFGVEYNPLAGETYATGRSARIRHSFNDAVTDLLDSHEFLGGGPTTQKLEAKLAAKLEAQHVVTCGNGTDALQLALRACGIDRGSRVAMPNLTFFATYEAIVNVGATPVLLDVDPNDCQLSYDEFVRAHNERRFDAAILVHLYGWCSARVADFRGFCRDRHITLIEDGAQAFGVQVDGKSIFADADVATLSFHPAKVLGGIGDGGAVVTRSPRVAGRVRALANHGRAPQRQHQHVAIGWNSRLDAIQAAWLLRALDVIDEVIEERSALHERYANLMIGDAPDHAPMFLPNNGSNGYMTVLKVDRPDVVLSQLAEHGIDARRIYPLSIADQDMGASIQYGPLMHSRALADHVISLPLYYGMTTETVDRVAKSYIEAAR